MDRRTIINVSLLIMIIQLICMKIEECDIPKEYISKREKEHIDAVNKIKLKVIKVNQLFSEGMLKEDIARETGYSISSVNEYLEKNFDPIHGQYGVSRYGPLAPFNKKS